MWGRDGTPSGRELVAGCEAFLTGRYVEHLVEAGGLVPAWAWTNLLAHGTEAQLRCPPTNISVDATPGLAVWCHARAYLAGEVLDLTDGHGPLSKLQAELLVPLELELASRRKVSCSRPVDWVTAVLAAVAPLTAWQHTRRGS